MTQDYGEEEIQEEQTNLITDVWTVVCIFGALYFFAHILFAIWAAIDVKGVL